MIQRLQQTDGENIQPMQSTGVSIIILTKNGAHHLKTLLETFFKHNTHDPVELIVIDHGLFA